MAISIQALGQALSRLSPSLPDVTKKASWFFQVRNDTPLTADGQYKTIIQYTMLDQSNYWGVYFGYFSGQTNIELYETGSGTYINVPIEENTYYNIGVTYDNITHNLELFINGVSHGTITYDISAITWDRFLMGDDSYGDTVNEKFGFTIAYYRDWSDVKLTGANFLLEAASNVPVTNLTKLTTDTPLTTKQDLIDHIPSNNNDWNTTDASPVTSLPGPLTGVYTLFGIPESKQVFFYDSDMILQMLTEGISSEFATAACPNAAGNVWVLYWDNASTPTVSKLREINPVDGSVIRTVTTAVVIGDNGAKKCLFELPNGNLISVKSDNTVVAINVSDGSIAHTYGLTGLDACINYKNQNKSMYYADGNILKEWDLVNDVALPNIKDFGFPVFWPNLLEDGTILVGTAGYEQDNDIIRVTTFGNVIQTYTYDHSTFTEGLYGFAARLRDNKLWLYGDWDKAGTPADFPAVLILNLTTGAPEPILPLQAIDDDNDESAAFSLNVFFVPDIQNLSVDCATKNIVINGVHFPDDPVIILKKNNVIVPFTLVFATETQIVVHPDVFTNGTYCASVS